MLYPGLTNTLEAMFRLPASVKIGLVFLTCCSMAYVNHLLFTQFDFVAALRNEPVLYGSAVVYLLVILLFTQFYWTQKRLLVLAAWLILNLSFIANFTLYMAGYWPPLYVQYSQSTSLLVFAVLLAITRARFPNWLRLFSLSCLLVLIPCLIFYFSRNWIYYEYCVYVLCFTPLIKSFVFLKEKPLVNDEVLDAV